MQERLATTQTDKHSDFKLGQWNLSGQKEFKKKKTTNNTFTFTHKLWKKTVNGWMWEFKDKNSSGSELLIASTDF